jgi:hypothetical protein
MVPEVNFDIFRRAEPCINIFAICLRFIYTSDIKMRFGNVFTMYFILLWSHQTPILLSGAFSRASKADKLGKRTQKRTKTHCKNALKHIAKTH